MTDFAFNGLLAEEYVLKRLVYVNSANHAYSEILLDDHLAMFGRNNVGKTASLAGTKLLLFPEVNFSNCEEKFRFVGNGGTYSQEDSYEFYFPEAISFIALEVQNPEGTFCMILYKTFGYTYGRMFVPVPYDELRHIFWDTVKNDFSELLSVKAVKQFVAENEGIQTSDPSEIKALMFQGMRGTKMQRRFCVLPMKDAESDSIEAFKNIYQLAFDIKNSEKKTLPKAIATLLEMGRGRDEERLSANLMSIAEEYEVLISRQGQLQTLKNFESNFERLSTQFDQLKGVYRENSAIYQALRKLLDTRKESFEDRKQQANEKAKEANEREVEAKNKVNELTNEVSKLTGKVEELKRNHSLNTERVHEANAIYKMLGFNSIDETLVHLDKSYSEKKALLKAFQQEDGVRKQLAADLTKLKQCQENRKELSDYINDQSGSVAYQLNHIASSDVIFSLNNNLALTIAPMTTEQIDTVRSFASLFARNDSGYLTFVGKPIKDAKYLQFNHANMLENARKDLALLLTQISELDIKISNQNQALKSNNIEQLVKETSEHLNLISQNRDTIRTFNAIINKKEQDELRLAELSDKLTSLKIDLDEAKNILSQLSGIANETQHSLKQLVDEEGDLKRYEDVLRPFQNYIDVESEYSELGEKVTLEQRWIDKISYFSLNIGSLHGKVQNELNLLLRCVPIAGVDAFKKYEALSEISDVVARYRAEYATLTYDFAHHNASISTHNQFVSNLISELKTSKQFLANFIGEINAELNNKHVSNLSEINLRPEIHSRFESLLATLEKHDITDETLLEREFYHSLARFADSYIDKKSRKLKMHDIIKAVYYEYTLEETGERVKKSQSGGTTSTITAFVLSVLIKKITPDYVSLRMPIIVDEIGTLDFKNTKATIQQISEHGFSIFCATPTFSGFISQNVGRWLMIDRARITTPRVAKCHMHIMPQHIESFRSKANEA